MTHDEKEKRNQYLVRINNSSKNRHGGTRAHTQTKSQAQVHEESASIPCNISFLKVPLRILHHYKLTGGFACLLSLFGDHLNARAISISIIWV